MQIGKKNICRRDNEPMGGKKSAFLKRSICSTRCCEPFKHSVESSGAGVRDFVPHRQATRTALHPGGARHNMTRQTDQCVTWRHNSKHTRRGHVGAWKGLKRRAGEENSGRMTWKTGQSLCCYHQNRTKSCEISNDLSFCRMTGGLLRHVHTEMIELPGWDSPQRSRCTLTKVHGVLLC